MATTFNWIYLGTTTTRIDPIEGNSSSESANLLRHHVYGSASDPLFNQITAATTIDNGGDAGVLDTNNLAVNDHFTTNTGAGTQTYTFDGIVVYNATITYVDGTTANISAVVVQASTGELFLAPETIVNTDTTAEEAKPIVSLTLNSINLNTNVNMAADRAVTGWDDGWVAGTDGNDLIDSNYVEPIGNGTDKIDGGDGVSGSDTGWQDDRVRAGDGNDTVLSGLGNDFVDGGAGADSIDGGDGSDTILGGDGDDHIRGGAGDDTLDGGAGSDTLIGDPGADHLNGGTGLDYVDYSASTSAVNVDLSTGIGSGGDASGDTLAGVDGIIGSAFDDTLSGFDGSSSDPADLYTNIIYGNAGNDLIDGRGGDDSLYGGGDNDTIFGGDGNDLITGDAGNDSLIGGAGEDTMSGGMGDDRFTGLTAGDVVDGGEDAGNTDVDVLDLFGSGWTKANTNILFTDASHENGTVEFLDQNGNITGTMSFSNIETIVPCFTPGTLIDTDRGPVRVEALRAGDRVLTMDHGYQTIRWIGCREVTPGELLRAPRLRPILISRGALGHDLPERDLRVSPQHRVLLSGAQAQLVSGETEVLAPAVHFLGLPGVVQDAAAAGVRYIHLLFDRHEIVRSDGLWTESFQPASATLSGMDGVQRAELLALFPGLAAANDRDYPPARSTVKRHEARLILAS